MAGVRRRLCGARPYPCGDRRGGARERVKEGADGERIAGAARSAGLLSRPSTSQDPCAEVCPAPWPYGSGGARRSPRPGCPGVLLVCGRAPGRALWPGPGERACMDAAWVGPLHWTQRAGGTPSPHSPQAADRSGGRTAPPGPCVAPVRRRSVRAVPGSAAEPFRARARYARGLPAARNKRVRTRVNIVGSS